jgi:hypothetical protein
MNIDETRAACHVEEEAAEQAEIEDEGATEVEEEAAASGAGAGAAASEGAACDVACDSSVEGRAAEEHTEQEGGEQAKNEDEGATEVEEEAAAAITPDSVTEESAALAASPAPLRAGAEAGGHEEVGTREAQRKRKHRLISEPRAGEVEVDEHARQRTWMGYLFGSARSLFQMLPRGSTRDYITPSSWWSQ